MLSIEDIDRKVILIKFFPFVFCSVSLNCQAGDIFYLPKKPILKKCFFLRDTLLAIKF